MKITLKTAVLALSLLTTSLHAFASGDGRSGDDRSGSSIPVTMDHRLTVAQFDAAVEICRSEAAISLVSQMTRQNLTSAQVQPNENYHSFYTFTTLNQEVSFIIQIGEYAENFRSQLGQINFGRMSLPNRALSKISVSAEMDQAFVVLLNNAAQFRGGIDIHFDVKKDSNFDEFGSLREEIAIVTKYHVSEKPIVRVQQGEDPRATTLRLSAEDFNQCLQNHLN